jgi:hypothetical protein
MPVSTGILQRKSEFGKSHGWRGAKNEGKKNAKQPTLTVSARNDPLEQGSASDRRSGVGRNGKRKQITKGI